MHINFFDISRRFLL